ncbi:MAG: peptidase M15 [Deltaproteobacteria bacterium CG_4_8_14_3_um_filter_51_11]|nr:M15 family metallopeptidase [bacterium]PIP46930.1 MAG: peptidase M15 [Deltaproteobacteria bacterium CG23_combo_of_CG06-09_8_20_14_all_51_20]PIX18331.1 MAG: peptidase M15 [Deltaproteobacteria bacterium CG_4_8_14_3_um_filter_51_11]PIY26413.1 MAG: peptidase M15 [Deltaproteobacteria bacterium CG_4_10_14_3_um_filter_51_14]PJB37095.1 MAG: peptidase M15 [Deltaproteobacteria bacterium CG_4_9_14_3_um_filter_51_14]
MSFSAKPRMMNSQLSGIVPVILAVAFLVAILVFSGRAQGAEMIIRGPQVSKEFLLGRFDPSRHPDFVEVALTHGNKRGMFLQRETYKAFLSMAEEGKKNGVKLTVISATRTFGHQKGIWEAKWKKQPAKLNETDRAIGVLRFTSMPGTSRHHWGTDIDLNSLENDYFQKAEGQRLYGWLSARAKEFGFCQPYNPKGPERPYGYEEEKWHWSYLPLAKLYLSQYAKRISLQDLKGFAGSNTAVSLDLIERYVLGINNDCR